MQKSSFSLPFPAKEPLSECETNPFAMPNEPFRSPKEPLSHPETNPFARKKSSSESVIFYNVLIHRRLRKCVFWRYFGREDCPVEKNGNMRGKFNNCMGR